MRDVDKKMFEAAGQGDAAGMERAIADGANICARDNNGWTVAMRTARNGYLTPELAECLARLGYPMDARDNYGWTTAMYAASNGHLTPELAECLSRLGCPMDARDNDGWTVAMYAASNGRLTPELAETLARLGCPMNARDKDGWTVAMYAARNGYLTPELAETLSRLGCPMDARDNDGWTVAMYAAWKGILTSELAECLARLGCPMDDVSIGKKAAANDRFASFAVWAAYAPNKALPALALFSNAKKCATGALVLLSSNIPFDEETIRSLATTFSKSRTGAVEHLLGDKEILRAIDGARFLELVSSGRALKTMDAAAVRNLLSMCRSVLDERPEKLDVVKTALSKTFAGSLGACADDPETAELLAEVMGRMAALDDAKRRQYDGDALDEPCL